jgi:hypothetical protein
MVVLFFAIGKNQFTFSTREFADYLKRGVIASTDQKKVVALEVNNYLKSLAWNYERFDYEFFRFIT